MQEIDYKIWEGLRKMVILSRVSVRNLLSLLRLEIKENARIIWNHEVSPRLLEYLQLTAVLRTAVRIPLLEDRTPPPVDAMGTGNPGGTVGARTFLPLPLPEALPGQVCYAPVSFQPPKSACHWQTPNGTGMARNLDNAACKLPAPCTIAKSLKRWSTERPTVLGNPQCGHVCALSNRCMCVCTYTCMHARVSAVTGKGRHTCTPYDCGEGNIITLE